MKMPFMENPGADEVLKYVRSFSFPCREETEDIIQNEISNGNEILHVGDVGGMPDETVILIEFMKDAAKEYLGLSNTIELRNGCTRKCVWFSDNNGAVEFRFGEEK